MARKKTVEDPKAPEVTPEVKTETLKSPEVKQPETIIFYHHFPQWSVWMRPPIDRVENGIKMRQPGIHIQFVNHEYRTNDPAIIEYIRKHKEYGTRNGIYENELVKQETINALKKSIEVAEGASNTLTHNT